MAEKDVAAAEARLSEFKHFQAQAQADKRASDGLRKSIEEAESLRQQSAAELEALRRTSSARRRESLEQNKAAELLAEAYRLKKAVDQLTADVARLKKELEAKRSALASKVKPVAATVTVRPSGSAKGLRPLFVECTQDSVVLHDAKGAKRVSKAVLKADAGYAALLEQVKSQPGTTVIYLVRSSGAWTFREASALADAAGVRYGKLPLPGQGALDLSLFGVKGKDEKP